MAISRLQQARQMRRGGGIMGSNAGSMLVAPTADGTRPGYYGPDAGFGNDAQKDASASFDSGSGEGISDADAARALANNASLRAGVDNAAAAKAAQQAAAAKEQERIQKQLDKYRGVTPAAYSYGTKIKPYDFSKRQPGVLSFGIIPTAINLAKKYQSYKRNKELRALYGLDPVDEIAMDMPNAPFGKSRVNDFVGEKDGPQPYILPQYAMMGGADMGSEDVEEKTFEYRMGDPNTNQALDVTLGRYFNQGGRITRAGGGIMNAVPRQGYFLGGIGKAVGKVVGSVADAAGKVLKSDLGKAALLAAGTYYAGGGNLFGMQRAGMEGFKFGQIPGAKFLMGGGKDNKYLDKFNPLKVGAFGLGALSLFGNKAAPNEDIGMTDRGGRLIDPLTGEEGTPASMRANIENAKIEAAGDPVKLAALNQKYNNMLFSNLPYENYGTYAQGGRIAKAEGGLMNLGGMEKDYRAEGGFVPIGREEKADDVPARLSVNEFVFTADAVRNAGGGDIDKGAEVMENMMKNLENGGTVSEESQGNTGAQDMFSVSERIGEVI